MGKLGIINSIIIVFISSFLFQNTLFAQDNSTGELVDQILSDVIDQAQKEADEVVREKTGKYYPESDDKGNSHSESITDDEEINRQLTKLNEQHDRKIQLLNDELDKKLEKYREQFKKEANKEKKSDKIRKKQARLEEKVDKANSKFNQKVEEENQKYDRKREQILNKPHKKSKEKKQNKGKGKDKDKDKDDD